MTVGQPPLIKPKQTRFEHCKPCATEPHGLHADVPERHPIIMCAGCKLPTRHRLSRETLAGQGWSLIWACVVCDTERIYGGR